MLRRALALVLFLGACGDNDVATPDGGGADPDADVPGDILAQLDALPGVTVEEWIPPDGFEPMPGYRYFDLWFTSQVDHDDPGAGTFQQYAALMHHDSAAPLVVYTSGYDAGWRRWLTEPAWLVEGNQLSLEYRFYAGSRPDGGIPWPLLRVDQAAADEHAILTLLDPIFTGNTIGTGASKGGEHALQYAQLYPEDMDGVVAYVAPVITDYPDLRYEGIFDRIGLPECKDRLRAVARELLLRRDAITPMVAADPFWPSTYDVAGLDHAYETTVVELEFGFWMTRGEPDCDEVPDAAASDAALYQFLAETGHPSAYGDQGLALSGTQYLYQDHVELGYPIWEHSYLDDLMLTCRRAADWKCRSTAATRRTSVRTESRSSMSKPARNRSAAPNASAARRRLSARTRRPWRSPRRPARSRCSTPRPARRSRNPPICSAASTA
jgi:hypothetical protein